MDEKTYNRRVARLLRLAQEFADFPVQSIARHNAKLRQDANSLPSLSVIIRIGIVCEAARRLHRFTDNPDFREIVSEFDDEAECGEEARVR